MKRKQERSTEYGMLNLVIHYFAAIVITQIFKANLNSIMAVEVLEGRFEGLNAMAAIYVLVALYAALQGYYAARCAPTGGPFQALHKTTYLGCALLITFAFAGAMLDRAVMAKEFPVETALLIAVCILSFFSWNGLMQGVTPNNTESFKRQSHTLYTFAVGAVGSLGYIMILAGRIDEFHTAVFGALMYFSLFQLTMAVSSKYVLASHDIGLFFVGMLPLISISSVKAYMVYLTPPVDNLNIVHDGFMYGVPIVAICLAICLFSHNERALKEKNDQHGK